MNSIFVFENLIATKPGTFDITAEGLTNGSIANEIIQVEEAIKSIQIQLSRDSIYENEQLNYIINVTNQYGSYFSDETQISIDDGVNDVIIYQ